MELPQFKYHPEPLTTGRIAPSDEVCEVPGRVRGYAYRAGTYGLRELTTVCPWCIQTVRHMRSSELSLPTGHR
jgi:uncharacterized protein CbrC (UPF0167 family)